MDKLLLSAVVLSGLCSVSSTAGRRYVVVHQMMNMADAQRHCRQKFTDLVTIGDLEVQNTLMGMWNTRTRGHFRFWIGLYEDKWKWSLSSTSFYQPGEMEYRGWAPGEPTNDDFKDLCTYMFQGVGWKSVDCEMGMMSVCVDVTGPTPFVLITNNMTWSEAQGYCREHHTDLASVRNQEEDQMLHNLVSAGSKAWMGLHRGRWKWSDGSDSSFRNWNTLGPVVSECAGIDFSFNGLWESVDCNILSAFICYVDPVLKRVVKVRLEKGDSSLDPNDPVVMENLLEKLQQRLRDQGYKDDIKLSWKKQSDGKVFHKEEKKIKRDEL